MFSAQIVKHLSNLKIKHKRINGKNFLYMDKITIFVH